MSTKPNGGFVSLDVPSYPYRLAARLATARAPDPDEVRELVHVSKRLHGKIAQLTATINELRRDNARLEHTVRLLSVEDTYD